MKLFHNQQENSKMKKHDFKKLALLGMAAGCMTLSQVATADEPRNEETSGTILAAGEEEETSGTILVHGCGGCGAKRRGNLIAEEEPQPVQGHHCASKNGCNAENGSTSGHGCSSRMNDGSTRMNNDGSIRMYDGSNPGHSCASRMNNGSNPGHGCASRSNNYPKTV